MHLTMDRVFRYLLYSSVVLTALANFTTTRHDVLIGVIAICKVELPLGAAGPRLRLLASRLGRGIR